ncbi:hypothetical protein H0O00_01250 [Candidatus Micrarchaeota archaeon]|nr:hypothetical protein [Candidatus Micrarchaeota archaeon]
MTDSFVGVEIAVIVVTASIVFAGILIGLGRAMGYKRIEQFGLEELVQSVINAAIIGSFAAIIELIGAVSSSMSTAACSAGTVIEQLICTMGSLNAALFGLFQELIRTLNIIGYYQSLSLDFGAFTISPFVNLASVSDALSLQLLSLNAIMLLVELNRQVAIFVGQNALALLFPAGLVLRTFFATRKIGGFLIALALGLYVLYPVFILVFPDPAPSVANSTLVMSNFTNNSYYATVPIIDLNDNYAIAGKMDILSGRCDDYMDYVRQYNSAQNYTQNGTNMTNTTNMTNMSSQCFTLMEQQQNYTQNQSIDMSGDLTMISQSNGSSLARSLLYAVIAPIFSLIITVVFVKELATLLGSEIGLATVASI